MNETLVTLRGNVGGQVKLRRASDWLVANFRLAVTPRRYSPKTGQWSDDETQWYTVNAWRALADNCARSLQSGDPVIVTGKLSAKRFMNSNNVEVTSLEVEAASVGHDLNRGTSAFTKTARPEAEQATPATAASAPSTGHEEGATAA